jgi:hypothetical protein
MNTKSNNRLVWSAIAIVFAISTFFIAPRVAGARAFMSIAVTNNSNRPILHLYLSPVDRDAWGPDLMPSDTSINNGQSFTITDVACSANEIKVIAEDPQGCFSYGVVSCAQATTSWTITNDTPADCGSN